jgi:hypothetical protein
MNLDAGQREEFLRLFTQAAGEAAALPDDYDGYTPGDEPDPDPWHTPAETAPVAGEDAG